MLTAISDNEMVVSYETDKSHEPFFCPDCGEELTFKNGRIRIAHFAHRRTKSCCRGVGESFHHMEMKRFMKQLFELNCKCLVSKLEHRITPEVRADYYAEIMWGNSIIPCAVEVVYAHDTFEDFSRKWQIYNQLGIRQLWIFYEDKLTKPFSQVRKEKYINEDCRLNEMQKYVYNQTGQLITYCQDDLGYEWLFVRNLKYRKGMWRKYTLQTTRRIRIPSWFKPVIGRNNIFLTMEEYNMIEENYDTATDIMEDFEVENVFFRHGSHGEPGEGNYASMSYYEEIKGVLVFSFTRVYQDAQYEPKHKIFIANPSDGKGYVIPYMDIFEEIQTQAYVRVYCDDKGDRNVYVQNSNGQWVKAVKEKHPEEKLGKYFNQLKDEHPEEFV